MVLLPIKTLKLLLHHNPFNNQPSFVPQYFRFVLFLFLPIPFNPREICLGLVLYRQGEKITTVTLLATCSGLWWQSLLINTKCSTWFRYL